MVYCQGLKVFFKLGGIYEIISRKTSLECILWSDLQVIFYVKHKTGEDFTYIVWYDVNFNPYVRYCVEFLTEVICFETITEVLRFITSYDETTFDSIEIEITN